MGTFKIIINPASPVILGVVNALHKLPVWPALIRIERRQTVSARAALMKWICNVNPAQANVLLALYKWINVWLALLGGRIPISALALQGIFKTIRMALAMLALPGVPPASMMWHTVWLVPFYESIHQFVHVLTDIMMMAPYVLSVQTNAALAAWLGSA